MTAASGDLSENYTTTSAGAVHWDKQHVRLLDPTTGELLREHRGPRRPCWPCWRGPRAPGAQIGARCATIHRRDGERGVRRLLGALALVKKHGAAGVEAACATAPACGVADYRFVRRYLERHAPARLTLRQVNPLIRELTHYRDVIARKTHEANP